MKTNISKWKIFNNKLPIFALFCFLGILYLGCRVNYWYLLLLVFIPFLLYKQDINHHQLIILILLFFIFEILILFAWQYGLVLLYKQYSLHFIRKAIFRFLDTQYTEEVSSFIKLVLFNVRTKSTYIFYKQTVDLGIVWLICVSGFYVSLLSKIISWCFKKIPRIGRYINISIILFYSYLLNFSYASLRVLLKICFDPLFNKIETKSFDRIGFIGLIICFFNPCCFKDYGFLLSFLICIGACCISLLELNSKIINKLLINVLAFTITIPFVISMNHKISLFTFINAFIFNFFSPVIFLYFLLFSWIPVMQVAHKGVIVAVYAVIGNISYSNIFIYSNPWQEYIIAIYYILLFVLLQIIYLIVINNKI